MLLEKESFSQCTLCVPGHILIEGGKEQFSYEDNTMRDITH